MYAKIIAIAKSLIDVYGHSHSNKSTIDKVVEGGFGYDVNGSPQMIHGKYIPHTAVKSALTAAVSESDPAYTTAEQQAILSRLGITVDENGICKFIIPED